MTFESLFISCVCDIFSHFVLYPDYRISFFIPLAFRFADYTYAQKCSLLDLLRQLKTDYPNARISGHRQLSSSIHKACPCFDAKSEYETIKN